MSNFGDFSQVTFINDSSPALNATNLNAMQDKIKKTDTELAYSAYTNSDYRLEYCLSRNYKAISTCDDAADWTAGNASTTLSQDTTNYLTGYGSLKMLENDASAGYVYTHRTVTALDLTLFQNGVDTSSTSDVIYVLIYVSDTTKVQALTLKLGTSNSVNYNYDLAAPATGWNAWAIAKSAFSTAGSPNWNNITYLHCEWYSYAGSTNAYVSLDFLGLYRSIDAGYPGMFAIKNAGTWANSGMIAYDLARLYYDHKFGKAGISVLDDMDANAPFGIGLDANNTFLSFILQNETYVLTAGELPVCRWYADGSNYVEAYISSSTAYLYLYQSGSPTTVSQALTSTLAKNTKVITKFEKNGSQFRVIFIFDNQIPITLESVTTIATPGRLYVLGRKSLTQMGFMTGWSFTNTTAINPIKDLYPRVIYKSVSETVTSSTVLQDDDHFNFTLPANGLYEIETVLYVSAGSTTPDFKCSWVLGGGSRWKIGNSSSIRAGIGMGTDSASSTNADKVHVAALGLGSYPTTDFAYGTHTGSWSTIVLEKMLVNVTAVAGTCKLQWAQNTSNANGTTINAGSYAKITKLYR